MSRRAPEDPHVVRIELENEWAWCGTRRLQLTPRAFAVLRHLVEHRERLVTKDELLTTVWRNTIVSDAALASCIIQISSMTSIRSTNGVPSATM
jgi:DNA-binding winged helix-turn-helix (wHTH) protein